MAILIADNVTVIYQGEKSTAKALDEISIGFSSGEKVLLYGESGSGKSTLLKVLCNLIKPTYGKVKMEETPIYVPSDGYFLENFSAFSNVYYWLRGKGMASKNAKKEADRVLESVGLLIVRKKQVRFLSGGEKNRLAIARAIALKPRAVFFDEITANLDETSKVKMIDLIFRELSSSLIVFSSHDKEFLEGKCTRIIKIEKGIVIEDSAPHSIAINCVDKKTKKMNGMVLGTRIFLKRLSGCLLFMISSVLLGIVACFSSYAVSSYEKESIEFPSYIYPAHFNNRLSSGDAGMLSNAFYIDSGSLLSDQTFTIAMTPQIKGGKVIVRDSFIQPIISGKEKLLFGSKDKEYGFYLCISENSSLRPEIYRDYIGKTFNLYQSNQYNESDSVGVEVMFNGIYLVKSDSLYGGLDEFVYLPSESLNQVEEYMKKLLNEVCQGTGDLKMFSYLPGYQNLQVCIDNSKLSILTSDTLTQRLGEEERMTLSSLVLPSSMKNAKWRIHYLSFVMSSSSFGLPTYYSDRLHSGECAISKVALKCALVNQKIASTGYYSNETDLKEDIEKGGFILQRGNIYEKKGTTNKLYVSLFCFACLIVVFMLSFLALLMLRWNRKTQDDDYSLCKMMGYSSLTLRLFGMIYCIVFSIISYSTLWKILSGPFEINTNISLVLLIGTMLISMIPMAKVKKRVTKND